MGFEKVRTLKCDFGSCLTVDKNHIYSIKSKSCSIYDFDGNLIERHNIFAHYGKPKMNIRIYKKKIYITLNDLYFYNWLLILSQDWELIKKIEISENNYGHDKYLVFTISLDIIYIYDFIDESIKS